MMRTLTGGLALAVAAFVLTAPPSRAGAEPFSDKVCTGASQYVTALAALSTSESQKVYDAAHATTGAYETCGKRYLADGSTQSAQYAYTRQAYYGLIEARALLALNRTSDAKAVLESGKRLVTEVLEWSGSGPGTGRMRSVYRPAAKDILDDTTAMLAQVKAAAVATAAPAAPQPTTKP
jgi:hypothetical protein